MRMYAFVVPVQYLKVFSEKIFWQILFFVSLAGFESLFVARDEKTSYTVGGVMKC